jgi:alpha-D-ribose 1-methylphosphonate 5-triphosphate diphosphatase
VEPSQTTIITNGRLVTPEKVLETGSVIIEAGRIVEINERHYPANSHTWDARGNFIMPGVINLHDDSYEKTLQPRKGVFLPPELAFHQMEGALATAGVTRTYHAVSFDAGIFLRDRTVANAEAMANQLLEFSNSDFAFLNHHLLYRCDLRSEGAFDGILRVMQNPLAAELTHYLSLNDHSPGQGQYAQRPILRKMIKSLLGPAGNSEEVVDARENELWQLKAQTEQIREHQLNQATALLQSTPGIIIAGHDDDSATTVDDLYRRGIRVCEFPINLEAATRAKELGLPVIAGSPNIVRGGSHTGNISVMEFIQQNLLDVLVADYAPSTLLHAIFMLVEQKVMSLVEAVRLVTTNAAKVVGLEKETGSLAPGLLADLIVVETRTKPQLYIVRKLLISGKPASVSSLAAYPDTHHFSAQPSSLAPLTQS